MVPRLNTRKNIVMAPISIGVNLESHTGSLLFSMYIGFQFLILFSPIIPKMLILSYVFFLHLALLIEFTVIKKTDGKRSYHK
tara:strand:+ start:6772 stop:7017 length:246 start_codon:yes stop_codon:yes gene_type:complete